MDDGRCNKNKRIKEGEKICLGSGKFLFQSREKIREREREREGEREEEKVGERVNKRLEIGLEKKRGINIFFPFRKG